MLEKLLEEVMEEFLHAHLNGSDYLLETFIGGETSADIRKKIPNESWIMICRNF